MKASIAAKLGQLSARFEEINHLLASEGVTRDLDNYRKLSREHAELGPVVELFSSYRRTLAEIESAQDMTADPEMRERLLPRITLFRKYG